MSQLVAATPAAEDLREPPPPGPKRASRRWRRVATVAAAVLIVAGVGYWAITGYRRLTGSAAASIPTAKVERGDVVLSITAKGELQGGNPEILIAPMTAGGSLHITYLRKPGDRVKAGDTVIQFDTTEQEYKLKEAQSDLAEAEQKIVQANANRAAQDEEDHYSLVKARDDLKLSELEARKNPLLASITAKQNDLAVQSSRDRLAQIEHNIANRAATGGAGVAMEQAGRAKAEAQASTARQNIEAMTLRAHHDGYVSVRQVTSNLGFEGEVLPLYQEGDSADPGVPVAEIPDLHNWQLSANITELDRGHIKVGDPVAIEIIAVPAQNFHGYVKDMGGTTGMFWDRHFETKIALTDPSPLLRPGMSARLVVTTETLKNVLSVPTQAVFQTSGRTYVYVRSGGSFAERDVKLVRENETRAVVTGLREGEPVALSNPLEADKANAAGSGPLTSVTK